MTLVWLSTFLCGLACFGVVLAGRALDSRHWAATLRAYRLHLPGSLTADDVTRWLSSVAAITHPARWSLLPLSPVCLEVVATSSGIAHYLLVPRSRETGLLSSLRAALPGVRIEEAPAYLETRPGFRVAAEARLTSLHRPLALDRAEGASAGLLAALQPMASGCELRLSWILTSAGTPLPVRDSDRSGNQGDVPWWLEKDAPADSDDIRAERVKQRYPLLRGVVRLGVVAPTRALGFAVFGRVWPLLHAGNAPGVRVVRRWLPSSVVAERMRYRRLPVTQWPVLANIRELAGLLALPIGGVHLPGLSLGAARQLPPANHVGRRGAVIGVSNYPGMSERVVALKTSDRLMHEYIVGPTGSGKSVLLARQVVETFGQGHGAAVFDPKGDLVADILARLPGERLDEVIVLDAQDRERPVGCNILGSAHGEVERELTVDNVLHVFRSIWAEFWGPRTDQVLRAGLSTLTLGRAHDGSRFTLCELPALLSQPTFRASVISRTSLPEPLRDYWYRFEALSEAERIQATAPVLNKVDAFVQRVPISLMLGQSQGIALREVLTARKLLLVNLAKGALGSETSNLLGSLLVSQLWQAALARVQVPAEQRRAAFAFIDECQDLVRLPLAVPDMLAQARGLGLGIVLANQYVAQLPVAMQAAVLGTVRTTISFAVDYDDAKLLERRFAPLTADDLMGLQRYEVAARCCVDGQTLAPCTLTTLPPQPPVRDPGELARTSRARYGAERYEVEAAMRRRLETGKPNAAFGRTRGRGGRS